MGVFALAVLALVAECVLRLRSARRFREQLDEDATSRSELHLPPYAWHPFLGQVHAANYVSATCVTDEQGYRNRLPIAVQKPPGEIRVLLAGGSTAAGAGAPDGETILDSLQTAFGRARPEVRVINVAQSAFNSSQELAQTCLLLLDLEPDVLVLLDGRNDFYFATRPDWRPHLTYRMTRFTQWYERTRGESLRRASVAATLADDVRRVSKASPLLDSLAHLVIPAQVPKPGTPANAADLGSQVRRAALIYAENVRRVALLALGSHCQLCVCLQPTLFETRKRLSDRERRALAALRTGSLYYQENVTTHYPLFVSTADATLSRLAEDHQFIYRNCSGAFDDLGPEVEVFLDDGHLTPQGQAIIAKIIYEAIQPALTRDLKPRGGRGTPDP